MYSARGKHTKRSPFSQSQAFSYGPFSNQHHTPSIFLSKFEFSPLKGLLSNRPSTLKKLILQQLDRKNLSLCLTEDIYANYMKKYENKLYDRFHARDAFVSMIDEWTHLRLCEFIYKEKISQPISSMNRSTDQTNIKQNHQLLTTFFNAKNLDKHTSIKNLKKEIRIKLNRSKDMTGITGSAIGQICPIDLSPVKSNQYEKDVNFITSVLNSTIADKMASVNSNPILNTENEDEPIQDSTIATESKLEPIVELNATETEIEPIQVSTATESELEPIAELNATDMEIEVFTDSLIATETETETELIHEEVKTPVAEPVLLFANSDNCLDGENSNINVGTEPNEVRNETWTSIPSETIIESLPPQQQTESTNSTCQIM
jgi:hypothetical protein